MMSIQITIRFYEELNDFLPPARRKVAFNHELKQYDSVKDVVESLGVPHTEIDLILVNGESVDFNHAVKDGDQISVRRVADYAVRNVKNIAERFIGNLNTQDGRDALKQKIFEFLQQMEKDTAIVPSTDGTDPAFKVDVYSTQRDFALGIVRLDIAVRPVRAMDYIYATILVQV